MDFKRIQMVLIIAFLLFDVYLFVMLLSRIQPATGTTPTAQTTIEQELNARNITHSEFAEETMTLPFISSHNYTDLTEEMNQLMNQEVTLSPEGVLTSTFYEPVDLGIDLTSQTTGLDDNQRQILVEQFLSDPAYFIEGTKYRNFWYLNSKRTIYIRMVTPGGEPIVDGSAEIRITLDENNQMVGYTQTLQRDVVTLEAMQPIISEREAIEVVDRRVETLIPDDSVIHYSVFAYYRSQQLNDVNIYSPAWQIIYDNAGGRYTILVDAVEGTVVNRNQLQ